MKTRTLVLPALALGVAGLLLAPALPSRAFSKTGESLGVGQRDVRLFNNFADASANDNTTPAAMFPGFLGANVAIWKGAVEWGSGLHGDGSGDPIGGNLLGDGGANFDAFWAGNATGVGGLDDNIVSAMDCGGGGVVAFTEFPASDGWRMFFCDEWVWSDGPGSPSQGAFDIQGVFAHEYGHALGLGHSTAVGATMSPSSTNGVPARSLTADDRAGIQCVYGVVAPAKPLITATVANAVTGTLTIHGARFDATLNEVWFTSGTPTAPGIDPIVRVTGVPSLSGGTALVLAIPPAAGPGDVLVRIPGASGAALSNAFPTDLAGTLGTPVPRPDLASVTPALVEALIPGTAETVTLTGTNLDLATAFLLDGATIDPARYTLVDSGTVTLDMPQADALGAHELSVTDGTIVDVLTVTLVPAAAPRLEWGSGDPLNVVSRAAGLDMILAGEPGELHLVRGSPLGPPNLGPHLFRPAPSQALLDAGAHVIPAKGWIAVHVEALPDPALVGSLWFARSFAIEHPQPFVASNDQSITLVP